MQLCNLTNSTPIEACGTLEAAKDQPYSEGWEMSRARALAQVEQEIEEETYSEFERFWADTV